MKLFSAGLTHVGMLRTENQDSFFLDDDKGLPIRFDNVLV